jgi:hypothetical protein
MLVSQPASRDSAHTVLQTVQRVPPPKKKPRTDKSAGFKINQGENK